MKITICGSSRFESLFHEWNKKIAMAGHIAYSLNTFPSIEGERLWYSPEQKWMLDLTYFAKIEESDAIIVLNKGGYIGESLDREIRWAIIRNKRIYMLEFVGHFYKELTYDLILPLDILPNIKEFDK